MTKKTLLEFKGQNHPWTVVLNPLTFDLSRKKMTRPQYLIFKKSYYETKH